MTLTALLIALVALIAGIAIGFAIAGSRKEAQLQKALAESEAAIQQRLMGLSSEAQKAVAERDLARQERTRSEELAAEIRARFEEAERLRVAAETTLRETQRQLSEQTSFVDTSRKQLEDSFAVLAQRTLKTIGEQMVQMNKLHLDGSKGEIVQSLDTKRAEIDALLKPLREMLDGYRGELQKSEQARNEVYGGLQEQIRSLLLTQESAQREASRLANALQSTTVQGSWGENSLRRCVELAGMSEFSDFDTQTTFETEEGKRQRPDLIVHLPHNRVIAVDAKAPLKDYIAAASETDEATKRALLDSHAKAVRRHIDALAKREYQASIGDSLDFTVLYLPGEHFLSAALVTDPTLFEYAAEKRVYLASPTVLLPLLRAVAAGWKAEKTEENAKKMQESGALLFSRFLKVMEFIEDVGSHLGRSVDSYNKMIRSIDTRLVPEAQKLQQLAGSGKELGSLPQLEVTPIQSAKLRLTAQNEEPGEVVPMK